MKEREFSWLEFLVIHIPAAIVIGLGAGVLIAMMVVLVTSMPGSRAWSHDWTHSQYADVTPEQRAWIRGLKNFLGVGCCDTSDGFPAEAVWDTQRNNYRVLIEGQWLEVPEWALIREPNRLGYGMVWYFKYDGQPHIRCFIPGQMS